MVRVSEVFRGIYGEAPYMGKPVVFVRFSGCNLNCGWCDERRKDKEAREYSVTDVVDNVVVRGIGFSRLVVVTGGEPLVQRGDLVDVVKRLNMFFDVSIETNGVLIDERMLRFAKDNEVKFVISPKVGSEVNWGVIRKYSDLVECVKFVVGKRRKDVWTLDGVVKYVEENGINKHKVALMPLSIGGKMDDNLCREIWDCCVRKGYMYSDRLHVRLKRR